MGKKKTALTVIIVLILCAVFYFLTNQLRMEEVVPQELRVIHSYCKAPGASRKILSDEDITDAVVIRELMDELEGNYLRLPLSAGFYRNEKDQHELCISWQMGHTDIDIRSNGRVVINGEPYLCLDDDTDDLYDDLLEILQ